MLEFRSTTLLFKFCLDPIIISLVLEELDGSLLTFNQFVTFTKSEFISLASSTGSCEEAKIWVSSANKQGVVFFRQFDKSLIYIKNNNGSSIDPCGAPQIPFLLSKSH